MDQKDMHINHTTPHVSPSHKPVFPGTYALIPFILLLLIGCGLAMAFYIRRRIKLDDLRHRLIPLYTYDPAEEEDDWGDAGGEDDEELTEPLYKEVTMSIAPPYGT
ncbi:small integral membrane protein 29-like [Pholidichthys leucotaenia]